MAILLSLLAALQADPERPPPRLKPMRYEEDWSVLRDPARRGDFFDPLKYIPLDDAGDSYLTLGGNFRAQMEFYDQQDFGTGPSRDTYLLVRGYPFADLHLGRMVRVFVMPKAAYALDTQNDPYPSQQNSVDLHQAFVDLAWDSSAGTLTLRPGRQEFLYGSGRLLDDRSGPNSKQTYDAVRLIYERADGLRVDVLYSRPVQARSFGFDDRSSEDFRVWGAYGHIPTGASSGIEPYLLGIERRQATFDEGAGNARRHAVGARFFSAPGDGLEWNVEPIYEFGEFEDGRIRAWGIYTDTGWTFASLPWKPRIGSRADVLSGDRDHGDGDVGTFDSFLPRGILHGEAGSFGPSNLIAITPELQLQPLPPFYFSVRWTFYWRQSLEDGIYTLNLGLYAPGRPSDERFIAHELSVTGDYYLGRHVILSSVLSFTKAGPFLRDSGYTEDQTFVSATVTVKF